MLTYNLDDHDDLPLYENLYRHIRDDILDGTLCPEARLPSKRALAKNLGVSVITVEGAYRQLKAEGYIASRERSGFYVQEITPHVHEKATTLPHTPPSPATYELADFSLARTTADSSFCHLWEKTLRNVLANEPESQLFAAQPPRGSLRLREAIAAWISRYRGIDALPEQIIVTAGAPMLYSLIALTCGKSGSVALESPGYERLASIYDTMGVPTTFVPLDDEGMDYAGLEASNASLVHIMPSHQFPTGRVTSVSRRYQMLGWASRDKERYIIEDDYDCEFRLSGKPIPALRSIDAEGKVIYLSTFSKSLGPSVRIAFGVFPASLNDRLEQLMRCFSSTVGAIDQIALAKLLESGAYERHVNRYRNKARTARDCLMGALHNYGYSREIAFEEYDSGLHFVLSVETTAHAQSIAKHAAKLGVGLAPLEAYDLDGTLEHDGRARFVMQYEGIDDNALEQAARIIHDAITRAERE